LVNIEDFADGLVDPVDFGKRLVERVLADHAAHRGLSNLADRHL